MLPNGLVIDVYGFDSEPIKIGKYEVSVITSCIENSGNRFSSARIRLAGCKKPTMFEKNIVGGRRVLYKFDRAMKNGEDVRDVHDDIVGKIKNMSGAEGINKLRKLFFDAMGYPYDDSC